MLTGGYGLTSSSISFSVIWSFHLPLHDVFEIGSFMRCLIRYSVGIEGIISIIHLSDHGLPSFSISTALML
jgi:hypothetical protein